MPYLRRRIATNKNAAKPASNAYVDGSGTTVILDIEPATALPAPPVLKSIADTSFHANEFVEIFKSTVSVLSAIMKMIRRL